MIIDCRSKAEVIKYDIRDKLSGMFSKNPKLLIVSFGDKEDTNVYIRGIKKDCEFVGIKIHEVVIDANSDNNSCIQMIKPFCDKVDGILIQSPLPKQIDRNKICAIIPDSKDIDGFKESSMFKPCTAEAVMEVFKEQDLKGAKCVVVNRNSNIGLPLTKMLLERDATVTVCHSKTGEDHLSCLLNGADIVVSAVGKRDFRIFPSKYSTGITYIDVGLCVENDNVRGDISISNDDTIKKANITPVPGGIGLITRAVLLRHIYEAHIGEKNEN